MNSALHELLSQLRRGTFDQVVHSTKFLYQQSELAEVIGRLEFSNGHIILNISGKVKFKRERSISLAFETETIVEGRIGPNITFQGRPTNRFGLFDLLEGTTNSKVEFELLKLTAPSQLLKYPHLVGAVNQCPEGLMRDRLIDAEGTTSPTFMIDTRSLKLEGHREEIQTIFTVTLLKEEANPYLSIGAAFYALSVLAGRRIKWNYFAFDDGIKTEINLFKNSTNSANFYQALQLSVCKETEINELFDKVHTYLFANPASVIGRLLGSLWDYSGDDFEVRALLVGIAIEGISKEIVEKNPKLDSGTKAFRKRVLKVLDRVLKDSQRIEGLAQPDVLRLRGLVDKFNPSSTKTLIQKAGESIGYTVSLDELNAWDELRNTRSHGKFAWELPGNAEWHKYLICVDLLNTLWLGAIGYTNKKRFRSWSRMFPSEKPAKNLILPKRRHDH